MNRKYFLSFGAILIALLFLMVGCGSEENTPETQESTPQAQAISPTDENTQIDHILQESEVMLKHYEDIAQSRPFTPDELKELSEVAQQISVQTDQVLKDPSLTTAQADRVTELQHRWMTVVHHNLTQTGKGPTAAMTFSADQAIKN